MARTCKDCAAEGITTARLANYPGPRCATHDYRARRARKTRAHELRIENTYGITGVEYLTLYATQGGVCAICQVATGKARRLAVDHDHTICTDHPPDQGCRKCIRGLLCSRCNELVGHYGIDAFWRAIRYLSNPPARKVLAP